MKKTTSTHEATQINNSFPIRFNLVAGDHLKSIHGLEYFKSAYDYEVKKEYPYLYLIAIRYRTDLVPESRNYTYVTISKVSIYCGDVILAKADGSIVKGHKIIN